MASHTSFYSSVKELKLKQVPRNLGGCTIYLQIWDLLRKRKDKKICSRQLTEIVMSQDTGHFSRFLPITPVSSECLSYSFQEYMIRNIYKVIKIIAALKVSYF